jgi:hypothetical protein
MCAFYKLENNNLIPIISKFIEKSVFTQYPINMDGIINIKHYYHIPLHIIETRSELYYYIDSIDNLNDTVNSIKRNIINENIIENENIVKKIEIELSKYKFHHPNFLHDDDYLLIEKRLYHANENLRTSKNMQLSSIFIEAELPNTLHNFFMV